jgi:serine phosphatase RsbU (regulator of sigma subunit)/CHASE2 domain-containing sensor protein
MFKSRNEIINISVWALLYVLWINLFNIYLLKIYNLYDLKIYDFTLKNFYRQYSNDNICYLLITDNTYKDLFKKNTLDRNQLAQTLRILESFDVEKIVLDILFLHPSAKEADRALSDFLKESKKIVQPIVLRNHSNEKSFYQSKELKLKTNILKTDEFPNLSENNFLFPYYKFTSENHSYGHISDQPDEDGILRHSSLILISDSIAIPSLAFSTYLSLNNTQKEEIRINFEHSNWGMNAYIHFPNDTFFIPLDAHGKMLIPYINKWGKDFEIITLENVYNTIKDINGFNRLKQYFNGKIVIVGDVSTGSSDLKSTPIDKIAPLIMIHSSVLNALLNKIFLKKINLNFYLIILNTFFLLLLISQVVNKKFLFWLAYSVSVFTQVLSSIILLMILGIVLPLFSMILSTSLFVLFSYINLQWIISKERKILEIDYFRKTYEMIETKKIQNSLLPKLPSNLIEFDLSFMIQTAEEVGGDFYDIFQDENSLKIFIADGSGHGLQAGTLVIFLKTILTSIKNYSSPQELFYIINNTLCEIKFNKLFLCLTMVKINANYFEYCTAGMPYIIHYKANDKKISLLRNQNLSLGLKKNFNFISDVSKIDVGDILFLATDGLFELFNDRHEMLEVNRVSEFLINNSNLSTADLMNELKILISNWKGRQEQSDDLSVVIVKKIK